MINMWDGHVGVCVLRAEWSVFQLHSVHEVTPGYKHSENLLSDPIIVSVCVCKSVCVCACVCVLASVD